ncbi:MAG: hypothetical protein V3S22_02255, partial [Candidatus Neomarinimicrobiota bacterium]
IFSGCEDKISDPSVSKKTSDAYFELTLTISNENVRLNESILVETRLERISAPDSLESSIKRMMIDAVGGTINGHSFSVSSSITVEIGDDSTDYFITLSSFIPSYSYDKAKEVYYNYMPMGSISAAFKNLQVTIPVQLIEP